MLSVFYEIICGECVLHEIGITILNELLNYVIFGEEQTPWKVLTWCQYVSRKEFQEKPFVRDMGPPLCGMGFHISVLDGSCTLAANIQHLGFLIMDWRKYLLCEDFFFI